MRHAGGLRNRGAKAAGLLLLALVGVLVAPRPAAAALLYSSPVVPAGYLSTHMWNDTPGSTPTTAGVYCTYYGLTQFPAGATAESSTPGSSSCAASTSGVFTFVLNRDNPADCSQVCGMNLASYFPQGAGRPWAEKGTELVLSANWQATSDLLDGGAFHGYICALLVDSTSGEPLLWCIEPWSGREVAEGLDPFGSSITYDDTNTTKGGFDVWTPLGADDRYATPEPYSQVSLNGVLGIPGGNDLYSASMTANQLKAAVTQVNSDIAAGGQAPSTETPMSTSAANYTLMQVQCGVEGGYGAVGTDPTVTASCANVSAWSIAVPSSSSSSSSKVPVLAGRPSNQAESISASP